MWSDDDVISQRATVLQWDMHMREVCFLVVWCLRPICQVGRVMIALFSAVDGPLPIVDGSTS